MEHRNGLRQAQADSDNLWLAAKTSLLKEVTHQGTIRQREAPHPPKGGFWEVFNFLAIAEE